MSWYGDAWNSVTNTVGGWGSDLQDYFFEDPADKQKKGLKDLSKNWQAAGANQRDWYGNQGAGIDSMFGQTERDINDFRNTDPTDRLTDIYTDAQYGGNSDGSILGLATKDIRPKQKQDYYDKLQNDPSLRAHQQEDYYNFLNGGREGLTNQEQLYSERRSGGDPAAQYEDQRAVEAINRQLAARGGYANSQGERQITDYYANAGAQRSKQLADLAAGADTSRLGKNSQLGAAAQGASGETSDYAKQLGEGAAGASQEAADWNKFKVDLASQIGEQQEKHFTDLINSDQTLANHRAEIAAKMTELGGAAMSDAQKEAFAAELAALGVDAQKIKDIMGALGGIAKAGATVAGS